MNRGNIRVQIDNTQKVRKSLLSKMSETKQEEFESSDIKKVVLILSSSRSGSSLLYEILKQTSQLLTLNGEHVAFFRLNGFSFPLGEITSDVLSCKAILSNEELNSLSKDIIADIRVGESLTRFSFQEFRISLALRLALQWPEANMSADDWMTYIARTAQNYGECENVLDSTFFLIKLLKLLARDGFPVNPYYYDLPRSLIAREFGCQKFPEEPPENKFYIEEPPFVVTKPRPLPTIRDIQNKPLVLKAPVDAYRATFIQRIFPNAEFRIIHLTRNPASSINGLYDGWLFNYGFFSHNVAIRKELSIPGYSDLFDWGKNWWNFDLPPNWESQSNMPLEYVCGFQWLSAHTHILAHIADSKDVSVIRVRFEDLLISTAQRAKIILELLNFIGIEIDLPIKSILMNMPVVMAVSQPTIGRWQFKKETILPVINQPEIRYLSNYLGYPMEEYEHWL